jgi:hypothetical protein
VPLEARVATFDQDGTTWVEHPIYTQLVYCLECVPAVVREKPKLKDVEPFRTVLSGNREAIEKLPTDDLLKIVAVSSLGWMWTSSGRRRKSGLRPPSIRVGIDFIPI